ncbi:MAG: cytidine deaminase, partial [Bdellovibrionota bacterium]
MTAPRELLDTAKAVRKNAYSPYSKVKVGAALRTRDGKIFSGCNVENSSYGATVCAERVAIQKAVSELGGKIEIQELVVVTDATPPWTPCGICRQVIAEFGSNSTIHS